MRQSHAAGDKLFVDYAGDGVPVVRSAASSDGLRGCGLAVMRAGARYSWVGTAAPQLSR
jgi:transposase